MTTFREDPFLSAAKAAAVKRVEEYVELVKRLGDEDDISRLKRIINDDLEPMPLASGDSFVRQLQILQLLEGSQQQEREIALIIGQWTATADEAIKWYRTEPIPAFSGLTAEALVEQGQARSVRSYLNGIAIGGYA